MGHTHRYQFSFKKKIQVKSPSPESRTPNSVRIRQSGRTGNRGVTQGSQGLGTAQSRSSMGQERIHFIPPHPSMGQRNQYQSHGATQAPSTSQTGHISQDQSAGQGRAQGLQAESSG